jgi:hypothetical protein
MLTQERLKELFSYSPNTGEFTRIKAIAAPNATLGTIAGSLDKYDGYIKIKVDGIKYKAHRLAFLYMEGAFPPKCVDHINGIRSNNSWYNLRKATYSENAQNRSNRRETSSNLLGVSWRASRQTWVARIMVDGKSKVIGSFKTKEEAHEAYLSHKQVLHGYSTTSTSSLPYKSPTKSELAIEKLGKLNEDGTINGVSWHKTRHKWRARATLNAVAIHLGVFLTQLEAQEACLAHKQKLLGN